MTGANRWLVAWIAAFTVFLVVASGPAMTQPASPDTGRGGLGGNLPGASTPAPERGASDGARQGQDGPAIARPDDILGTYILEFGGDWGEAASTYQVAILRGALWKPAGIRPGGNDRHFGFFANAIHDTLPDLDFKVQTDSGVGSLAIGADRSLKVSLVKGYPFDAPVGIDTSSR